LGRRKQRGHQSGLDPKQNGRKKEATTPKNRVAGERKKGETWILLENYGKKDAFRGRKGGRKRNDEPLFKLSRCGEFV